MFMDLLSLAIKAIFVENMIFALFLGMCSYLAVSKKVDTSIGMGCAVMFVTTVTCPASWFVSNFFLKPGPDNLIGKIVGNPTIDLTFLTFVSYIALIAAMVQFLEMFIEKVSAKLYGALGVFLPLIAVNCAILGGSLMMNDKGFTFAESAVFGFSGGLGWLMAIAVFAAIREKMQYSNVPKGMRGLGIAFLTCGLMAMAFMGFMGIKFESSTTEEASANPEAVAVVIETPAVVEAPKAEAVPATEAPKADVVETVKAEVKATTETVKEGK